MGIRLAAACPITSLGQLQEFTHRGMNDYLQIKFNTVNPATISLAVHHNILQVPFQVSKAPVLGGYQQGTI